MTENQIAAIIEVKTIAVGDIEGQSVWNGLSVDPGAWLHYHQ